MLSTPEEPRGDSIARLSTGRVRNLSVEELGLDAPTDEATGGGGGTIGGGFAGGFAEEPEPLAEDHPLLATVRELLEQFGGLIFVGPPGTGKSWYAKRTALALAGSSARVRFVQFHPSYQYEDFVQGYVPSGSRGFTLQPKHLMYLAGEAEREPNVTYVIVIDELSRGDAARIFGEALTYVERTKRGWSFSLASGDEFAIPPNLAFIATMNPLDRGVDEVDAAFERRFAKIAMDPSEEELAAFLEQSEMAADLRNRVTQFFRYVNGRARENPLTALGQTFFLGVADEDDLRRVWRHQLRFFFEKAWRLDRHGHEEVVAQWERIFGQEPAAAAEAGEAPEGATAATG